MRRALAVAMLWSSLASSAVGQPLEPDLEEPGETVQPAGRHCLGQTRSKWVIRQLLGAQVNPGGVENTLRAGVCIPLITRPGPLFDYTHVEIGVINALAPAYAHGGAYVEVTPLSLLQIRAEVTGLAYWEFPFPRAGYYALSGYDASFDEDALPSGDGASSSGWQLRLVSVLRFKFPRDTAVKVFGLDLFEAERWSIGDADHYFNLRRDLVTARTDWVLSNEALLGIEFALLGPMHLRVGAFDSFRTVPAAGYGANQVGLFVMPWWERPHESVYDLAPFVRVGVYTGHAFRAGTVSVLAGALVSYDLGAL